MVPLKDLCYAYLSPVVKLLLRTYKGLEDDMEAANLRIHPEVYLGIVVFLAGLSAIGSAILSLVLLALVPSSFSNPYLLIIICSVPPVILISGLSAPKMVASNRISGLKNEIPYASMYLSVMVSGGLSPYASLLRLRKTTLLPQLRKEIERIQRLVLTSGQDPVTAMTKAAKVIGLRDFKELLLGYASTLKTGGDVLHYLYSQTESMFKSLAIRVKAMGENMGMLLEAYTIVAILGALGLYMVFIVSLSFPSFEAFPPEVFFLFAFIILPGVSIAFLYFGDTLQISNPVSQWKMYMGLLFSVPLGIFLLTQLVLPFFDLTLLDIPFLTQIPVHIKDQLGLNDGSEAALGLAISLIAVCIPVCVLDSHYSENERGILQGVTSFLRDLVENRKTGLSPEKSIQMLSDRDYGNFSNHLMVMSTKISWGISIRRIFEEFVTKVKNWPSLVNMYLLIDTIEVGGGTEESLETLAEFAESSKALEIERRALLKPLLIVPYMGAALLTLTTVMLLQLFANISTMGETSISIFDLTRMLITPLVLHSFTIGLVAGKIVAGRTSAGFKHSVFLILISIIGVYIANSIVF
ncbi:MAG: type II secretion system F family protein [Candidatus Bathyarchaeia archaeon]